MSVARAFTKRTKRPELPSPSATNVERAQSVRKPGQKIDRNQISLPVTLISTTNMLSYNAPDIATLDIESLRKASASSSTSSLGSSQQSVSSRSSAESIGTVTDASSVASSPLSPTVEPNHLTSFFKSAQSDSLAKDASASKSQISIKSTSTTSLNSPSLASPTPEKAPVIPARALSHSKSAHESLARQRSNQSRSPSTTSKSFTSIMDRPRPAVDAARSSSRNEHPFGRELEQLDEVVEEFGKVVRETTWEEDTTFMQQQKLVKFSVADYLMEITPLFAGVFENCTTPSRMDWI